MERGDFLKTGSSLRFVMTSRKKQNMCILCSENSVTGRLFVTKKLIRLLNCWLLSLVWLFTRSIQSIFYW